MRDFEYDELSFFQIFSLIVNKQEDSIDNACKLGLKDCDRVPKFRKLINSVDYWNHLKEMDDE